MQDVRPRIAPAWWRSRHGTGDPWHNRVMVAEPDGADARRDDPGRAGPDEPTAAEAGGRGGALTVAAVARRLGVAPATLRTWDRRYGLGPSEHAAGHHRRYAARDVDRLLVMRRLTIDGVAPAEAARLALSSAAPVADPGGHSDDLTRALPAAPAGEGEGRTSTSAQAPRPAADTAGGAAAAVVALVDAALAGRADRCAALLALAAPDDVARWWSVLVQPSLAALARRTVVERPGVDARETLVGAVLAALRAHTSTPPAAGAPVVLVLPAPGEPRPVLAHVLAAALVDGGVDARLVAGPVSPRHAGELALMTRARAVVTIAEGATPDLSLVTRLAHERTDLPQFVMVAETAGATVPLDRSVHRSRTLTGLLHEALAVVLESPPL